MLSWTSWTSGQPYLRGSCFFQVPTNVLTNMTLNTHTHHKHKCVGFKDFAESKPCCLASPWTVWAAFMPWINFGRCFLCVVDWTVNCSWRTWIVGSVLQVSHPAYEDLSRFYPEEFSTRRDRTPVDYWWRTCSLHHTQHLIKYDIWYDMIRCYDVRYPSLCTVWTRASGDSRLFWCHLFDMIYWS